MNWLEKVSQEKVLFISRGPSGSGKSQLAKDLATQFNAPVFSTDDFWMSSGTYQFDPAYIDYAHFWNQGRVEESIQGGVPVIIVDNTNTQFWEMKPYVEMAQKYGYSAQFKEPDWHPELKTSEGTWNVDFLEQMQDKPDRDKQVPREVLETMVANYEYGPTVEAVLKSERSGRPETKKEELEELHELDV